MKEMLYIFFYAWYIMEYIIICLTHFSESQNEKYHRIKFEKEVYNNEHDLDYLNNRPDYAWLYE